jgi:GntR family transcriptional regulator
VSSIVAGGRGAGPGSRWSGARPVDRDSGVPLWQQVHEDLLRRVRGGEFTDEFPGELALVEAYGVSRHTVREALRRLREDGVVSGERGRTSRITGPAEIDQPLGTLYSLFASVEAAGQTQRSVVRARDIRADGVVARRLSLEESTPLLYLERLRLASDRPLALDRVWLPAEVARPLLDADFSETALYEQLRIRCGIRLSGGEEHMRAVVPTSAERRILEMPDGVAALTIERLAFSGRQPVEWRHTVVRGDRFAVSAEFSARTGYQLTGGASAFS